MNIIFSTALSALLLASAGLAPAGTALAQSSRDTSQGDSYARSTTSTGATVPNAGRSQIGEPTEKELKAQRQSDKIMRSICKNC